jgi:hypothetical protein
MLNDLRNPAIRDLGRQPVILDLKEQLERHPVYASLETISDLRCFMEHHVYSVWDFMSLLKFLQEKIAPTNYPWYPHAWSSVRRFINEIVMEEESDQSYFRNKYSSHFEIYQDAMREIGADVSHSEKFIESIRKHNFETAIEIPVIPPAAKQFMKSTFNFISSAKPHVVGAAFAFGREQLIPDMFEAILERIGLEEDECPIFHYYIDRHIEVDDGKHGPLSIKLIEYLAGEDTLKEQQVLVAAVKALKARLLFWDEVLIAIKKSKNTTTGFDSKFRSYKRNKILPGANYGKNEEQYSEVKEEKKLNIVSNIKKK